MNELKFCSDSSENLLIINPKNGKQLKKNGDKSWEKSKK